LEIFHRRTVNNADMSWSTTEDVDEFRATAGQFLRSRAAEHMIILNVAETLRRRGRDVYGADIPRFGWWRGTDGAVGSAFLRTPPHPVLLERAPVEAAAALAATLATLDPAVSGVNATPEAAEAFAAAWCERTGARAEIGRRTRLYRLGELLTPSVPGTARPAAPVDRELLIDWYAAFGREIGEDMVKVADFVDAGIAAGELTLWEVDGVPVSMAAVTGPIAGVFKVAPVFTPAGLRRRGYGGAATAAVSRAALDAGATDVVLYTDLANPTSNSVYQRLGYRPVHDRVVLTFAN
jgi:FR47-like protein